MLYSLYDDWTATYGTGSRFQCVMQTQVKEVTIRGVNAIRLLMFKRLLINSTSGFVKVIAKVVKGCTISAGRSGVYAHNLNICIGNSLPVREQ